jgi:hypothetical protein
MASESPPTQAGYFWTGVAMMYAVWLGIFRLFGMGLFLPNAFGFMMVGRHSGWAISRHLFLRIRLPALIAGCIVWGFLVAYGIRLLIDWQQPSAPLRWVMGYAMGCYIAIPHYGLFDWDWKYDGLATVVPLVVFVVVSITLSYLPSGAW